MMYAPEFSVRRPKVWLSADFHAFATSFKRIAAISARLSAKETVRWWTTAAAVLPPLLSELQRKKLRTDVDVRSGPYPESDLVTIARAGEIAFELSRSKNRVEVYLASRYTLGDLPCSCLR